MVFDSLSALLSGNITTSIYANDSAMIPGYEEITEESSQILQTGLNGCDDFTNNFWNTNPVGVGNRIEDSVTFVPWQSAYTRNQTLDDTELIDSDRSWIYNKTALPPNITNFFNNSGKPQWMCRNRTLISAVEDLMNNLTISLPSKSSFTLVLSSHSSALMLYQMLTNTQVPTFHFHRCHLLRICQYLPVRQP